MKRAVLIMLSIMFVTSLVSCQKKEEPTAAKSPVQQGPIIDIPAPAPGHGTPTQRPEFSVVVPPEVKEMWSGVTITIDDKQESKQTDYTVALGNELKIPDSNLTVKVGPFLPDFKMSGEIITSASNEPNNPAVGITIFEDGTKVFPPAGEVGWLYSKFPTIHSFQHERYGLILKAGSKKE
ncbi:MAG: hypothetical protein AMK71_11530 [Nitrospira bacterium SG8_35_4]|nr:MAG: hypothetical protein AMK71_11530 [Nitrospira bacterium SG8_35_4]